jgi:replicative DNA helicase
MSVALENMGKVPPQNLDAEAAVLGGILVENEAMDIVLEHLTADDFYREAHRKIFRVMVALHEKNEPCDTITISEALRAKNELEAVGGLSYLVALSSDTASAANIGFHARIVREKSTLRSLIRISTDITDGAYSATHDVDEFLDTAERKIFDISEQRVKNGFVTVSDMVTPTLKKIEEAASKKSVVTGLATGFTDLDRVTAGLQNSDLIILAGRPGTGKSAFSMNIGANVARNGGGVAVFSLEMSREQLVMRLLCGEARVDSARIRSGFLRQADYPALVAASGRLKNMPIHIDDTAAMSILELRAKARRLARDKSKNLKLVIVDYLQLVRGTGAAGNREGEVGEISRSLKALAKDLQIPVVGLAQLNRKVEERQDKRPVMSDLRESGCLTGETAVYMPISGEWKRIDEVKVGDRVLAMDRYTWTLEPRDVTRTWVNGVRPVFTLRTALGRELKATVNHKFMTTDGWKALGQINVNDHIVLPRTLPEPQATVHIQRSSLALLAHMIGNGCMLQRHCVQYTSGYPEMTELVARLAIDVFGDAVAPRTANEKGNCHNCYLPANFRLTHGNRNPVAAWLEGFHLWNKRSYEKHIPDEIFRHGNKDIAWFVKHLWATDGTINAKSGHQPTIAYSSTSHELSIGVQNLLLRLGICARLHAVPQKLGRDSHIVTVSGAPDMQRFLTVVGPLKPNHVDASHKILGLIDGRPHNTNRDIVPNAFFKNARWNSKLIRSNVSRERCLITAEQNDSAELELLARSDVYWDRVVAIAPAGEMPTFDITVDALHNFVANGVIAHNSIEQDADVIMFLYRDEVYSKDPSKKGQAECIISKHRNGALTTIPLTFIGELTKFENHVEIEPYYDDDPELLN